MKWQGLYRNHNTEPLIENWTNLHKLPSGKLANSKLTNGKLASEKLASVELGCLVRVAKIIEYNKVSHN